MSKTYDPITSPGNAFYDMPKTKDKPAQGQTPGPWTVQPVMKHDGRKWDGLAYVSAPSGRLFGSMNEEQAKVLVAYINESIGDLLAELKATLQHGSAGNENLIRAAIAKAEGRAQ